MVFCANQNEKNKKEGIPNIPLAVVGVGTHKEIAGIVDPRR
jgi:hypothetical protein